MELKPILPPLAEHPQASHSSKSEKYCFVLNGVVFGLLQEKTKFEKSTTKPNNILFIVIMFDDKTQG